MLKKYVSKPVEVSAEQVTIDEVTPIIGPNGQRMTIHAGDYKVFVDPEHIVIMDKNAFLSRFEPVEEQEPDNSTAPPSKLIVEP